MKDLITEKDIVNAANLQKFKMEVFAKVLLKLTGADKINELYNSLSGETGLEFIESFFEKLDIQIDFDESELKNIPANGAFITISNHPFGAIDGLLLLKIVSQKRPDFKVLANFLLQNIDPLKELFIGVNPFENIKDKSSLSGIKEAITGLQEGKGLGIFPAGEVSSFQSNRGKITDKEWQSSAVKLIKKAEVPVIPIYFSGTNSFLFQLLGFVHPNLRTARLPKELLKMKKKVVKIRIGSPIPIKDQKALPNLQSYTTYLRAKTYLLGSALDVKKFFIPRKKKISTAKEIIDPIDHSILEQELNALPASAKVVSQQEFDIFLVFPLEIPACMKEIGRLREHTFRSVGEGSNNEIDVDEYDLYYHQLILWDREAKQIAGGYRLGLGKEIIAKYGVKGFYSASLFKIDNAMAPTLSQTIELGRSYVVNAYQQKRLPLFLLWKGIMHVLVNNPDFRYIIGPVSISNDYSKIGKSVIVKFIRKHYFNHDLAQYIKPSKRFKEAIINEELNSLVDQADKDLKKIDKLLMDIEPSHFTLPILLKKYIGQNAKIIGFNVDPAFNNSLDGLMILDLNDLPADSIENLRDDINKSL